MKRPTATIYAWPSSLRVVSAQRRAPGRPAATLEKIGARPSSACFEGQGRPAPDRARAPLTDPGDDPMRRSCTNLPANVPATSAGKSWK